MSAVEQLDRLRAVMAPAVLPDVLRRPEFRFCKAGFNLSGLQHAIDAAKSSDAPEKAAESALRRFKAPKGAGWQQAGYAHDSTELTAWLQAGGNYGIIAGTAWEVDGRTVRLFILDADDVKAWAEAGFFDDLPKSTLAVQSSTPGKLHYYYLTDLESSKAHFELPGFGHLKFRASQCIGPGSLHPSGCRYTVIDPSSPAYVPREVLEKAILRAVEAMAPDKVWDVKDMFDVKPDQASRLAANAKKLEEIGKQDRLRRFNGNHDGPAKDEASRPGDLQAVMARVEGDDRINPCLRRLIAGLPVNHRFEAMVGVNGKPGEGEHALRRAAAVAWIKSGYSDEEFHLIAANFDDYNPSRTQQQLDSVHRGIEDKGITYSPCRELQAHIPPEFCAGCSWTPPNPAADELKGMFSGKQDAALGILRCVDDEHFTEGGNAQRLERIHGDDLRYNHTLKRWLVWDGGRWKPDVSGEAELLAYDVVKMLYDSVSKADGKDAKNAIIKFAKATDSRRGILNMLAMAANLRKFATVTTDYDRDPWLLAAGNVTIDLKTCSPREPRREDLITKSIGAKHDPGAQCPRWLAFLDRIFAGDQELISYVQRAVGYCLTGSMGEQVFFFCHGKGANGKSTFLAVIRALMGDYATQADFNTFLVQRNMNVRNDLAALDGVRFITAIEAEEGSRLSMSVIKSWTGGDPITARYLFGEYFTFKPVGKIWLAANEKPIISERNLAAWRRVRLIPFNVTIPDEERVEHYEDVLAEELPGILNWALDGLRDYLKNGMRAPKAVLDATAEYRRESDSLEQFIQECCELGKLKVCRNADLYLQYRNFCEMSGLKALTQTKFSTELKERPGVHSKKTKFGVEWLGIDLKTEWVTGCQNPSPTAGDRFGDGVTANTANFFTPEASRRAIQNPVNPSPNEATRSDDGLRQPITNPPSQVASSQHSAGEQKGEISDDFEKIVTPYSPKDPSKASRESMILPNPSITAKRDEEEKGKESSKGKIGIEKIVDSLDAQDAVRHDHFAAKAAAVTVKPRPVEESTSGPQEPVENGGAAVKPDASASGLSGFRAAMARRKCSACEKTFPHDLALWKAKNGIFSYICPECRLKIEGDRNCGSCKVALVGDKGAIKCDPCIYLGATA